MLAQEDEESDWISIAKGLPASGKTLKRRRSDSEDEAFPTENKRAEGSTRPKPAKRETLQPPVLIIESSDDSTASGASESELTEIEESCRESDTSESEDTDYDDCQAAKLRVKELLPQQQEARYEEHHWLPHTALKLNTGKSQKTYPLLVSCQTPELMHVIHESHTLGIRNLIFGGGGCDWTSRVAEDGWMDTFQSPLASHGLDAVAFTAMIDVAKEAGYNGQGDIIDKFANGSMRHFVRPLVAFGTKRLRNFCTGFVRAIEPIVHRSLTFDTRNQREIRALLDHSNYIYPRKGDKFDRSKPFGSTVVAEGVKAAFFSLRRKTRILNKGYQRFDIGLIHRHELTSSTDKWPDEHEVTPAMVLFASTAIAAVLKDKLRDGLRVSSTGMEFDKLFKDHLLLLATLRERKPIAYHQLMYGIFKQCCKNPSRKVSKKPVPKEIIDDVEWDLIPDA